MSLELWMLIGRLFACGGPAGAGRRERRLFQRSEAIGAHLLRRRSREESKFGRMSRIFPSRQRSIRTRRGRRRIGIGIGTRQRFCRWRVRRQSGLLLVHQLRFDRWQGLGRRRSFNCRQVPSRNVPRYYCNILKCTAVLKLHLEMYRGTKAWNVPRYHSYILKCTSWNVPRYLSYILKCTAVIK